MEVCDWCAADVPITDPVDQHCPQCSLPVIVGMDY